MRILVHKLDKYLRQRNGIFEFSQDKDCLLRLQVGPAPHTLQLPDITVEKGEPVLLLHLWNERLVEYSQGSTDMVWAKHMTRLFIRSLFMLKEYLQDSPQDFPKLNEAHALGGATILVTAGLHDSGILLAKRLGFTVMPYINPLGRFGEFWENFYSWLIIWTFNPGSIPSRSIFRIRRAEIWMSRETFIQHLSQPLFGISPGPKS